MKKYSCLFLHALIVTLMIVLLSGCNSTTTPTDDEQLNVQHDVQPADVDDISYSTVVELVGEQASPASTKTIDFVEYEEANIYTEAYYTEYGIGGPLWECGRHWWSFHHPSIFLESEGEAPIVSTEAFTIWSFQQHDLELATGECHHNIHAFIQHFGISREVFQKLIDGDIWWYFQYGGDTLDILYSGDWALIDHFFSWEGPAYWDALEREDRYYAARIRELQQIVNENVTEMSWYFHDVWTHSHFTMGKSNTASWMQRLIDAGEYDRVNVIEFLYFFNMNRISSTPGITIFEGIANRHNMNIFTHYNFDILLSGDWDLIRDYYCITNEAAHSAQVQARFDAYVAANRYTPDTSWMVSRPPTQIAINPATATVQRGSQQQFAATASGPGNTSQAVTWGVHGAVSSGTTITDAGLLRVAQDETAATLTVRAVSAVDTSIYSTAAITVTAQPPQSSAPSTAGPSAPSGTTQRPPADSYEHDPQQQDDTAPGVATIPEPPPIPAPPSFINPFVDVHERDWFFDYVMYVYQQKTAYEM